ncbi:MAG: ABC transporter ATP-binding protein [Firmicutes bacterium]|uniref:ABC transporter ATP-binding protein n=1 Tax=Geochorda subterranea TaxID=3109564 RepID=A0ABZ1BR82_9FIRM|nr:ABC transporter ATP-binding protein [Limnochorda sp. LNt]NLG68086.1 ABC transporter ATP-binding protein [Bacillota bacterium]WRP15302.1 ABC transporter ATP-binding protein [Limnochorda sp. LNt]
MTARRAGLVPGNGDGTAAIRLQGVSKVYGRGESAVVALRDVDLTVAPGEYVAITGPSGSGKSTLMHLLGCLDRPTSGKILIEGQDVTRLSEPRLAALRNRRIGFVFQSFHLMPRETVLRNVEWPLIYAGLPPARRRERALQVLSQVGMAHRVRHRPQELSGGERQRVAIARALVNDPAFILADEPTGNLDSANGEQVLALLEELNAQGRTVILVTHDMGIAHRARRLIRVRDGRVEYDGGASAPPEGRWAVP